MACLCLETAQRFTPSLLQGGWTALMWACYKGRTEAVELLLSHGANPSVTGLVSVSGDAGQCREWDILPGDADG